jgi:transmembrane sensor
VIYDEVTQNIKPSLVEKPKPIGKAEQSKISLIFQSRPLQEVLNVLSKLYGIDFVVSNEKLNQCWITADLNDLDMYIQLELICKSIDAQYEKRGTVIFVNGEGC